MGDDAITKRGAVAAANEEAVRAWDTVLHERWESNRRVFVGALAGVTEEVFELEDARREAVDAGVGNVAFEIADAQTAEWDGIHDYAFSRMGTQFFAAPVPAMRVIRGALKPGGRLAKACWRRKAESPFWAETEQVVERLLSRPAAK